MNADSETLLAQLASIRTVLALPIPDPVLLQQVFLRCDCCGASMRSETAFVCRGCFQQHGGAAPCVEAAASVGMEQIDAMHAAADEARASGEWN